MLMDIYEDGLKIFLHGSVNYSAGISHSKVQGPTVPSVLRGSPVVGPAPSVPAHGTPRYLTEDTQWTEEVPSTGEQYTKKISVFIVFHVKH